MAMIVIMCIDVLYSSLCASLITRKGNDVPLIEQCTEKWFIQDVDHFGYGKTKCNKVISQLGSALGRLIRT